MQADVDAVKKALEGEDDDAVKKAFDTLTEKQQKIGEAIYAQQDAGAAGASDQAGASDAGTGADDDVVDAEVVDDDEDGEKK